MNLDGIQQAKKGNIDAFEKIIEENKIYLYNIANSILENEEDAGDALSITVYNAYKYLKKLKNDEFFKTWITRILINECKKILKKRKNDASINEYENILYYEEDRSDEAESILSAINSLKKELRNVIILFYYNNLKISEIAKILNIPEGTVKSRMNTAKKNLYEILK